MSEPKSWREIYEANGWIAPKEEETPAQPKEEKPAKSKGKK